MPFLITSVQSAEFPTTDAVRQALELVGLTKAQITSALEGFQCSVRQQDGVGYQQFLARALEDRLRDVLKSSGLQSASEYVSPKLNERADLALKAATASLAAYFEIEFRPNVEKDLIKFQIAFNANLLGVGVLILATNRGSINASYTTMPEFAKVTRVVQELQPKYALLILGIDGRYV